MIGHVYCRYFADLFGGQALGAPTYYALAPAVLPGTPRHYDFGEFGANRRESIEAPTRALALALPLALALAQALTRTLTRTRALTVPLTPAQTLALSMTSLSLSLARSAEPEPEPGAGAVRGVQRGWRGARFRGGAADHRGGDASGLRTQRGALLRGRPAVERRGARRRQHGRRVRTRKTARLAPAVYRPSVSSPGGGGLLRPPSRVSVNLVPLLWTGVPTRVGDKNLCRCFGAPGCRVFPDHVITWHLPSARRYEPSSYRGTNRVFPPTRRAGFAPPLARGSSLPTQCGWQLSPPSCRTDGRGRGSARLALGRRGVSRDDRGEPLCCTEAHPLAS